MRFVSIREVYPVTKVDDGKSSGMRGHKTKH